MIAAIQSPLIQRFVPYLARLMHVINITIICLSLVLFIQAWSISNSHTEQSTELTQTQSSQFIISDKQLDNSRLWFVNSELGGGAMVTDSSGLLKNRLGNNELAIYLTAQSVLLWLISIISLGALVLLVSNNYLRLVVISGATALVTLKLQTPYLFTQGTDITTLTNSAILLTSLLLLGLLIISKWLLQNNHISDTLIAYASQSGSAMSLAKRFNKSITHTTDVRCLSSIDPSILPRYNEVLIIASTYGEGQPPEKVKSFVHKLNEFDGYKDPVNYSILALGDSHYPHFCAFGHQLEQLLSNKGAKSLLNLVEVDKLDIKAINTWWQGLTSRLNWQTTEVKQTTQTLQVVNNTCVNPRQSQRLAHSIEFKNTNLNYQVGDLLEITPRRSLEQSRNLITSLGLDKQETVVLKQQQTSLEQAMTMLEWHGEQAESAQQLIDKLPEMATRVYSIASTPEQDNIEIFVRRYKRPDGNLGVASNYLCDLEVEQTVNANIRVHPNFHLPKQDVPLILIGAGTGIAPLISFLRHKTAVSSTEPHWLFFGEQYQQTDFYYQDEIEQMLLENTLTKLNLAWSRDDNGGYIGAQIEQEADTLLTWINELNAHIYICGNRSGFGDSVCSILLTILGQEQYDQMLQEGKLRTDLY